MKKILTALFFLSSLALNAQLEMTLKDQVLEDYRNFYTSSHGLYYFSSVMVAGVFANTKADEEISSFYQKKMRTKGSDTFSSYVKPFGNRSTMLGFLGAFFVLKALEPLTKKNFALTFFERVSRMLLVGVPPLLLTQSALGSTRPSALDSHSHWKPFQNNHAVSASGHSFFGALPFLALASMTDSLLLKVALMAASTLTAFSRLNDNKHYFSQIFLGWSLAFMSFDAIQTKKTSLRVLVQASSREFGLGVSYRFQ